MSIKTIKLINLGFEKKSKGGLSKFDSDPESREAVDVVSGAREQWSCVST